MNLSKKKIIKNINLETGLSSSEAASLLELFLMLIKAKSKSKVVKIGSFGSFSVKKTSKGIGRNRKARHSCIMPEFGR